MAGSFTTYQSSQPSQQNQYPQSVQQSQQYHQGSQQTQQSQPYEQSQQYHQPSQQIHQSQQYPQDGQVDQQSWVQPAQPMVPPRRSGMKAGVIIVIGCCAAIGLIVILFLTGSFKFHAQSSSKTCKTVNGHTRCEAECHGTGC